jgi:hypothetical protein
VSVTVVPVTRLGLALAFLTNFGKVFRCAVTDERVALWGAAARCPVAGAWLVWIAAATLFPDAEADDTAARSVSDTNELSNWRSSSGSACGRQLRFWRRIRADLARTRDHRPRGTNCGTSPSSLDNVVVTSTGISSSLGASR